MKFLLHCWKTYLADARDGSASMMKMIIVMMMIKMHRENSPFHFCSLSQFAIPASSQTSNPGNYCCEFLVYLYRFSLNIHKQIQTYILPQPCFKQQQNGTSHKRQHTLDTLFYTLLFQSILENFPYRYVKSFFILFFFYSLMHPLYGCTKFI